MAEFYFYFNPQLQEWETVQMGYVPTNFAEGFNPPAKPKATPTIEDCVKLMKTAKGFLACWNIAAFVSGCVVLCDGQTAIASYLNASELYAWLESQQPTKTVMVELLREDAASLKNNFFPSELNPFGSRICEALKKALEA